MTRLLAAVLVSLMLGPALANAASETVGGPFGLGIVIGEPSGITGKYWFDSRRSADVTLSFNLDRWILIHADALYAFPGAFQEASRGKSAVLSQFTPYLGVGGVFVVSNRSDAELRNERYYNSSSSRLALGIRVPFGVEWRPPTIPIGVFLELAPGLTIMPATSGFFQGGIGARYYF